MSTGSSIEASRTQDQLRAAYAGAMAKQVAGEPQDLAVLRARFQRRGRELRAGLGSTIEGRAAWILACFESSLPDELLEAELLRLHADDPRIDLGPLREMLAAREEWKEARADPQVPPVVLHVLARRLGVPPRARATAQDVAHPRRVADHVRETYSAVYALDAPMFRQIGGMPTAPSRRVAAQQAASEKKSGRVSFWAVVFAIWVVAKILGLAVKHGGGDDLDSGPERRRLERVGDGLDDGSDYQRTVRRLDEVRQLEREVRIAGEETRAMRSMTVVRRQRLRELLGNVRYGVEELVPAKAAMLDDLGYPRLDDLGDLSMACLKAADRLEAERLQILVEHGRADGDEAEGGR